MEVFDQIRQRLQPVAPANVLSKTADIQTLTQMLESSELTNQIEGIHKLQTVNDCKEITKLAPILINLVSSYTVIQLVARQKVNNFKGSLHHHLVLDLVSRRLTRVTLSQVAQLECNI